ncbi:ABC transporter ATP-binding protein [Olsenella uli]|uniref:ABC transporter ATP-binding protein n=1 Tax=Olsenella uli TaxID=133926 RepID=UPI001957B49C|nr:ABC transporter ATP-binding protein [Olsenella uli]MBM6675942.1 ABC transporter ATP-binding protein [Olsenella uli]
MRILRLFKNHVLALLAVAALLVVSASADLTLPSLMSEIVDVGIQQGGVESPVPDTIRASALADLELFMTDDDAVLVEAAYAPADDAGVRAFQGTDAEKDEGSKLARALELPEVAALALEQGVDASALGGDATLPAGTTLTLDDVCGLVDAGVVSRDQLAAAAEALGEQMGAMGGTIVTQRSISYVSAEYEAQGIAAADVQNAYLGRTALEMFGLCLVSLVATVLTGAVASHTAATIARDLRRETFAKVMRFSPAEVNKFSQASLITRCTNDIQQIQMAVTMFMRLVLLAPIMGAVAVVRVLATSTDLEWTIGVAVIAVCAVVGVLMGLTMPKFKVMQRLVDRVNLVAREMLDGIMPIRAFGRQDHELERFDQASRELMGTQLFTNRAMSFMMPLLMFVMNCVTVLIVWFGSHGVADGVMQVGDMMAFISYTMQIVMAFMILTMVSVILPRAEVAVERVDEVRECPLSVTDPARPKLPAEGAPRGELTFRDVSFQYPDARYDVIQGVSFTTRPGHMTGIIGSTGSGKSTLVQLIPRLYDVTGGAVLLDGVDVRDWSLSELRRRIGYVPQQGMLFSGTVETNLKFAGDCVSDEDMREAARVAQAEEFIEERPEGYDAPISQGGTNVSGGQRQRLAIARALAKHPEVVVFDDSFSALDYATDARLRAELARTVTDAAVVVVGQRIATIMHADEILVLDEGHVVGRGTHEELLRTCPAYLEIAQSQLSAEELGLDDTRPTAADAQDTKGGER